VVVADDDAATAKTAMKKITALGDIVSETPSAAELELELLTNAPRTAKHSRALRRPRPGVKLSKSTTEQKQSSQILKFQTQT
jgi:hypothetical protein